MKKGILFLFIGILLLSIPVVVFVAGKNTEMRKRAAPATTLSISPATVSKKVDDLITFEVKIDTADNQVATVQLAITYDPLILRAEDITNGSFAPTIRVSGKTDTTGKASITVGAKNTSEPIKGSGTIAVLTMKALSATTGSTTIRFAPAPETFANALGEGEQNVLVGATGSNVTITNANGTSPTPSPTGSFFSPTPTATPSDTLTPTTTPSETPSITPSATPSGSLTPTPEGEAGSSAVIIETPVTDESVSSDMPTFTGTAPPGSSVTLTIYSEPTTVVVTTDANGNWSYTPSSPLAAGSHTVVALATNPQTGATSTQTTTFIVASGEEGTSPNQSSTSSIPASGNPIFTVFLITIALLFITAGTVIPTIIRSI